MFTEFSQVGDAAQPSPSVWGDCPNTILNDKGLGYFFNQDFLGVSPTPAATTTAPGIETFSGAGTAVIDYASSATFGPNVLSMATGATDNNNTAVHGEELGQIVRNSGKKFWFETRIAPNALGDTAFFVGLTTRAGARTATTGLLSDNPSNSAAATTVAVSTIGFISVQAASALATVNAIYEKTSGTPVTVLSNVTNATAIASGDRANLVAQVFHKFAIRFDGGTQLRYYVDGVKVATVEVDSTFDQSAYYVPVVAAKNGASTALTLAIDFVRAGFQARS